MGDGFCDGQRLRVLKTHLPEDLEDWNRWAMMDSGYDTRRDAIERAMRLG